MCKNTYTEHSELTKLRCSFPRTILRCNFSPKLLRWTLSASLQVLCCRRVPPTPCQAGRRRLGYWTGHHAACALPWHRRCPCGQTSVPRPRQRVEPSGSGAVAGRSLQTQSCHGTVPSRGQRGDGACNVTAVCRARWGPFHLVWGSLEAVLVPGAQLMAEPGSAAPHRFRLPIPAAAGGEVPLCKVTALIPGLATRSQAQTPARPKKGGWKSAGASRMRAAGEQGGGSSVTLGWSWSIFVAAHECNWG